MEALNEFLVGSIKLNNSGGVINKVPMGFLDKVAPSKMMEAN
jgi:hypothetical protein